MRTIRQGPLPVVAALNGATIGAGLELALACDLCVACEGARLQLPPVRLGLIYTPLGVSRLLALCGLGRTRQLLLTAEPVLAQEALSWGLVQRVVPAAEVVSTALQLARRLAGQPQLALRGTRFMLERLLHEGPQLGPDTERELLALRDQSYRSPEARAARTAFRARARRS
jgi:enoyl-CoA hydratase/carnithine racemase